MNNLPTAEEYCRKHQNSNHPDMISKLMIEFAKLHVKAALMKANENVEGYNIDEQAILNAYPESNIK